MFLLRILLKIILEPVSLVLLVAKGVFHLAINLTSAVIGLFLLYVGFALVYCLVTQRWTDLFIFFIVSFVVVGVFSIFLVFEEILEKFICFLDSI